MSTVTGWVVEEQLLYVQTVYSGRSQAYFLNSKKEYKYAKHPVQTIDPIRDPGGIRSKFPMYALTKSIRAP